MSDLRIETLRGLGYTGSLQDMLIDFYKDHGATSDQLNDAEYQFLESTGISKPFNINDGWGRYLSALGYTGSTQDKSEKYWAASAAVRYFRRNLGTDDYATVPTIALSGDIVIEFDVNAPAQDDNNTISFRNVSALNTLGLASGGDLLGNTKLRVFSNSLPVVSTATTMDVFDNVFHKIRFEYTLATTSFRVLVDGVEGISPRTLGYNFTQTDVITLWRDVTTGDEMSGILANFKIYDDGVLVRDYPMNDNSTTLADLVAGEDGTIVNGTSGQWGLFQKQAPGEWLGQELVVNGGFDDGLNNWLLDDVTLANGRARIDATIDGVSSLRQLITTVGLSYRCSIGYVNNISGSNIKAGLDNGANSIGDDISAPITADVVSEVGEIRIFRIDGTTITDVDSISVKEVLNVA